MRYVKSLDGVRGIAVLLVILFHYGYVAMGWVGVQVFFTLSGYLITSILLEDRSLPFGAYLGRFYWRRSLRIFPLFFFFLAGVAATYATWGIPASFGADWPYLLTYTANFARARDLDIGPVFVHIWSLAVEEQFYLVWPLLLFLLPPRGFRVAVVAILLLSPVVRLLFFQSLTEGGRSAEYAGRLTYVLPFAQLDAFAAGAAIPVFRLDRLRSPGRWFLVALAITGLLGLGSLLNDHFRHGGAFVAALGYPMFMTGSYQYAWGYSILNVLSALAVICTVQQLWATRILANAALVRVGKVSYGVYVYHLPVLILGELAMERLRIPWDPIPRAIFFAVYLAAVMAVSEVSFRYLEAPFLKLKDYWAKRGPLPETEQASS